MGYKMELAQCAAINIENTGATAPEWVHLLPAGTAYTMDGRGPYKIEDPQSIIANSMVNGDPLVLDENHSTDLAAPQGWPAPARGWITKMESRKDGIWGRVVWTSIGKLIAERREYKGVSPVILHVNGGGVRQILRASLTNTPNLKGLATLHSVSRPVANDPVLLAREARAEQQKLELEGVTINFASAVRAVAERGAAIHSSNGDAKENATSDPVLLAREARVYQAKMASLGFTVDIATAVRAVADGEK